MANNPEIEIIKSNAESARLAATDNAPVSEKAQSFKTTRHTASRTDADPADRFSRWPGALLLGIIFLALFCGSHIALIVMASDQIVSYIETVFFDTSKKH